MINDKIYCGDNRATDALLRLYLLYAITLGCALYITTRSEFIYKLTCDFHSTYILFDGPRSVRDICDMVLAVIFIVGGVALAVVAAG